MHPAISTSATLDCSTGTNSSCGQQYGKLRHYHQPEHFERDGSRHGCGFHPNRNFDTFAVPGAVAVDVAGSFAYVGAGTNGLTVIDVK